jgi:hypothetical protein
MNSESQPTKQADPSPPKSPTTKWIIFLISSILFILAYVTGLLIYRNTLIQQVQRASSQIKSLFSPSTSTITPTQSPAPTTDPATNWDTYTNESQNISLKYPPDWIVVTSTYDNDVYIRNQNFNSEESKAKPRYPDSGYPDDYIYLRIVNSVTDKDVKIWGYNKATDWYKDLVNKNEKANLWTASFDLSTARNCTIGNIFSTVVKSTFTETVAEIFVPDGSIIRHLIVSPYERFDDKTVDQILSTFQFLVPTDTRCALAPDPGPCKAHFPSFYFDQKESSCKQFIWGGCSGVRPFKNLETCKSACEKPNPPISEPVSCQTSGCNGEICSDKEEFSICVALPEHGCYANAICEIQENGSCGWTQTEKLKTCLEKY